jgi:hypothetical protein
VVKKTADIRSLARAYTDVSIETLGGWVTAPEGVDPEIKIRAIGMLLDRGWGKPNQPTENKIEGEVNIILRDMMAERAKKK